MQNETVGKCPQNTHNGPDDGLNVNSEDCEDGSKRIGILFSELKAVGRCSLRMAGLRSMPRMVP